MSNPVLNDKFLENERVLDGETMSINGTISKTLILFLCLAITAIYTFSLVFAGYIDHAQMLTIGGAVVGFVIALVMIFSRNTTLFRFLSPVYALAEGCFIGGISAFFESFWTGIVAQAIICTMVTILMMLGLYRVNLIRATEKFRSVVIISTASICAIYLIQILASFFFFFIPQIFTASPIGIGFSLLVVAIAALNLILDFDFIEKGSEAMLQKDYEWYGAFGLMVTIVWLYLEILKLLAKFAMSRE